MSRKFSKLQVGQSTTGKRKEKLNVSEPKEDREDSSNQRSSVSSRKKEKKVKKVNHSEEKSATVESPLNHRKKIWKDRSPTSRNITLTMKLSKILDQDLTRREKVSTPFWMKQSEEISKKLWLPTQIDSVDSTLKSSKELYRTTQMDRSWFSIKNVSLRKKKSLKTSWKLSNYSLPESEDSEAPPFKGKSVEQLRTLKIRIFPNESEKERLKVMFEQARWYYNALIYIFGDLEYDKKVSNYYIRDQFMKYRYIAEEYENEIIQDFEYDEELHEFPVPDWWERRGLNRLIRGVVNKFTYSLNSAISNLKNRNIKKFKMEYRSSKSLTDYLHFEDKNYPTFLREIKSRWWYTTTDRRRVNIPYSQIFEACPKGMEIIYEKATDRYFVYCPVERDWFPEDDRRREKQSIRSSFENRLIALDPGIRKFLVGYDPKGRYSVIGQGACHTLIDLLKKVDLLKGKEKNLLWIRIKNLIEELHWKVANFLTSNYDHILLPDFRTSQMVTKGKKLSKTTRRLMNMFSFHSFKTKLRFKCSERNKKLYIVNESYTSKTCGKCGELNDLKGDEIYSCKSCGFVCDRDINGSRNILLKNITPR
jgi:putative transposase